MISFLIGAMMDVTNKEKPQIVKQQAIQWWFEIPPTLGGSQARSSIWNQDNFKVSLYLWFG